MFSAIIPELMTSTLFALSLLTILVGRTPRYFQSYEVMFMNVTDLKATYHDKMSEILPIHDFYSVHLTTHCAGYYHDGFSPPITNVSCSPVSGYAKFLPASLIVTDLLAASSNATLNTLSFPAEIQANFMSTYNLQLHVSYIFFVMSLIWTGMAMLWGLVALAIGEAGIFTIVFTSSASTCSLISSAILTATQSHATGTINLYGQGLENGVGNGVGVMGGYGSGLLVLSWTAFGLSTLSSGAWVLAGMASAAFRS